ncbi:MAG TPA: hypothetical protein VFC05_01765 [Nitrososphaeraceae archaeon]|nr:hypothetical protein [Nitrososphaeraceae archaeon]
MITEPYKKKSMIKITIITKKNEKFLKSIIFSFFFAMILSSLLQIHLVYGLEMDVKCTIYENSDDENGDHVDVRIFVIGLKGNNDYTAEVIPDHNLPTSVTAKTDYEGTFWAVAKVPNGEKSILFNVNLYEGNGINGDVIVSGDDDTPCHPIPSFDK